MSTTVRGLTPGRITITDHSNGESVHHFDVSPEGTVDVGTDERLDLLLSVYPDAVGSPTVTPPKVEEPAPPVPSRTRKPRAGKTK